MARLTWTALFVVALNGCAADYPTVANIHYDRHPETVLDIIQPRDPALRNRPGVIVIHGGGWVQGSKEDMLAFCKAFVERGFVVANVDYRLAGVALAPAAVIDVLNAAKWFHEHAGEYKVDPERIFVAGFSAGGNLALLTGMLPKDTDLGPVTKIVAVLNFSGIADVSQQVEGPNQRDYAAQWIPPQPDRLELAKKLSPITYVRRNLPPIVNIHGDADETVPYEQSVRLTNALKQAGAKAELIAVPGGRHEFTEQQINDVWPQIFKWLKKMKLV